MYTPQLFSTLILPLCLLTNSYLFSPHLKRQNFWLGTPGPDTQHVGALGAPHILRDRGIKPGRSRLDSCFILDVNVLDGTTMAPSTPFTKIWRMRNTGNLAWPRGSQLVWIGGDRFTDGLSVEIEVSKFNSVMFWKCFQVRFQLLLYLTSMESNSIVLHGHFSYIQFISGSC